MLTLVEPPLLPELVPRRPIWSVTLAELEARRAMAACDTPAVRYWTMLTATTHTRAIDIRRRVASRRAVWAMASIGRTINLLVIARVLFVLPIIC